MDLWANLAIGYVRKVWGKMYKENGPTKASWWFGEEVV